MPSQISGLTYLEVPMTALQLRCSPWKYFHLRRREGATFFAKPKSMIFRVWPDKRMLSWQLRLQANKNSLAPRDKVTGGVG